MLSFFKAKRSALNGKDNAPTPVARVVDATKVKVLDSKEPIVVMESIVEEEVVEKVAPAEEEEKVLKDSDDVKDEIGIEEEKENLEENEKEEEAGKNEKEGTEDDEEEEEEEEEENEGPKRKKMKKNRKKDEGFIIQETALSEYELQRLENIRRNHELLQSLQVLDAVEQVRAVTTPAEETTKPETEKKKRKQAKVKAETPSVPRRTSGRLRSLAQSKEEREKAEKEREANPEQCSDAKLAEADGEANINFNELIPAEKYFSEDVLRNAIKTDGHFRGWVNPEIVSKYGLDGSAEEAWKKNGGGSYSYRNPLGQSQQQPKASKSAKEIAKVSFRKNPNCYFYRHTEPGVEQWMGDWTAEEKAKFLEVAGQFGCGDKWGLFASYIPHRVGYQSSAFYRQVILAEGLVVDPNYRFTNNGVAIYVGARGWRKRSRDDE
ncbi:uncharacterized protein VTP21DRAFT_7585 [Calcarisporiella thermophila]|uniref:uncharacterized protein n=1 Tax=Calcarisporiella thermophila TaxID=911321 RepID=UPI003743AE0C